MPEFKDLPQEFSCPYRHSCPYLEGLSTRSLLRQYQETAGWDSAYEYQLQELYGELEQERQKSAQLEREKEQLRAQLQALHRRQFKARKTPAPPPRPEGPSCQPKKRGAPVGHPGWQRSKPKHIDQRVHVPAPKRCPDCDHAQLGPLTQTHEHVQEDIVLEPRTLVTCFEHGLAYCPRCDKNVWLAGPGEMPGAYIGPAAKATAAYLRYQLNVSDRKISRFFDDFFGLKFVPASVFGFERQVVRRGRWLYEDLRQKIRSLPVAHADETSWRHDGHSYWAWYAGNEELAFYHLDAHRSAQAAQVVLGEHFAGTLVADGYASYNGVHPKGRQSCLAHIKTKAKELEAELALLKGRAADPAARQFCQNIQGWVRTACQAHQRLSRGRWRTKAAQRQGRALGRALRALCGTVLRYPKAENFRKRLVGPEHKLLLTCFGRAQVPPTNNQAERSLRPLVLMRRVVQGTRSDKGLENHSVLRSLFETAQRQGKKPHEFFLILLTQTTVHAQAALYRKPLPHLRC